MRFSEKFIKANDRLCDFDSFEPAPYFRKDFTLDFKPESAEITICGLGFYELYINGENTTKGHIAPYVSNPDDIYYYDNYEISHLLNKGENTIGIILGNGFRNCYGGFMWDFDKSSSRGPVCVALCLEAEKGDLKFELEADKTFKTHPSPILYNDLRMGYCYDANLEIKDWNKNGFDDSDWNFAEFEEKPKGIARLCEVEPILTRTTLKATEIKHYDKLAYAHNKFVEGNPPVESTFRNNVYVYDFGVNTSGVTRLKIKGKPGQKITIRHGEHPVNGEFSINTVIFQNLKPKEKYANERYLEYANADVFICKGGEEEFVPKFKYDGFRYAFVEGLEPNQATKDALVFEVFNSDIKERGSFECSDETLNKLQAMTRVSDLSNFHYFPTDCPHREKNGWTADAWLSAEHMLLNLTVEKSLREWMFNIQKAQRADGALPGIIPTGGWGFKWGNGPVWDSVCVEIPYALYKYTGDKEVIKENASLIMRYLKYVSSMRDEKGLTGFGLGDWCDPFEYEQGFISSPIEVTASMATLTIADKAAFLFGQADLLKESEYAKALKDEMRESIRENLVNFDTMTVKGDCQTSQALALEKGIFNEDEKEKAEARLVEIIHRDKDINTCGVYGIRYIYHILSEMGETDLALKLITSTRQSCYGHWVKQGSTTLCESFKAFDSPYVDSRNHHFFGDISSWFIQQLAGLKPNPNGDDITHFEISPNFAKTLSFAKAEYDSPFGKISVKWEKSENTTLFLSAPEKIYGKIILPKGYTFENSESERKIESGKYIIKNN